jgi:hypothetical protein
VGQLPITYGTTFLVADGALHSAKNLQTLAETPPKWVTRIPETLSEA